MNFLEKLKGIFKKGEFPVKTVSIAPVEKTDEDNLKVNQQEDAEEQHKEELQDNKDELLEILNEININKEELALDKIQGEAETINTYVKGLIKDLTVHQDFKHDKEKTEQVIKSIGSKIKLITNHGLELKNLLANLEDHYYRPLIDQIKKLNEKLNKEEVQKIINDLENDLNLVRILDTQMTKVIGYNELFNQDKNLKYKEEIEKEAVKRVVHGDLNELTGKILATITDRSISIKSKIEKLDYITKIKEIIN